MQNFWTTAAGGRELTGAFFLMQSTFRKEEVETIAEAEWTEDRRREELSSGLL